MSCLIVKQALLPMTEVLHLLMSEIWPLRMPQKRRDESTVDFCWAPLLAPTLLAWNNTQSDVHSQPAMTCGAMVCPRRGYPVSLSKTRKAGAQWLRWITLKLLSTCSNTPPLSLTQAKHHAYVLSHQGELCQFSGAAFLPPQGEASFRSTHRICSGQLERPMSGGLKMGSRPASCRQRSWSRSKLLITSLAPRGYRAPSPTFAMSVVEGVPWKNLLFLASSTSRLSKMFVLARSLFFL